MTTRRAGARCVGPIVLLVERCWPHGLGAQAFYAWRKAPVSRRDCDEAHLINAASTFTPMIRGSGSSSSPAGGLHDLADPPRCRNRPGAPPYWPDLEAIPDRPGPRHPGRRLRTRRHRAAAAHLHPDHHRAPGFRDPAQLRAPLPAAMEPAGCGPRPRAFTRRECHEVRECAAEGRLARGEAAATPAPVASL